MNLSDLKAVAATADIPKPIGRANRSSVRAGVVKPLGCAPKQRMGYAKPKMKTVVAPGSSSGVTDGSNIDKLMLNSVLRHTRRADAHALKHGDLRKASWKVIGKRNLFRAARAVKDDIRENCPVAEMQHVVDGEVLMRSVTLKGLAAWQDELLKVNETFVPTAKTSKNDTKARKARAKAKKRRKR